MRISLVSLILLLALVMPVQASLEPRLAGNWKSEENPGMSLQIQSNGSYTKVSNGSVVEQGTLDALNRNFKFHSSSGNNDSGTFSVIGNKLILRGTMNPTTHWVKSTSSKALYRTGAVAPSKALMRKPSSSSSWNSSSAATKRTATVTKYGGSTQTKYTGLDGVPGSGVTTQVKNPDNDNYDGRGDSAYATPSIAPRTSNAANSASARLRSTNGGSSGSSKYSMYNDKLKKYQTSPNNPNSGAYLQNKYSSLSNNLNKNYSSSSSFSNNNYVPPGGNGIQPPANNNYVPPGSNSAIPSASNSATTQPPSNVPPTNQPSGVNNGGFNVASGANAYQRLASNRYAASSVSQAARAFGRGNIKSGIANLLSAARNMNSGGSSTPYVPPGGNLSPVNNLVQKVAPGVANNFPMNSASDGHGTLSAYRKAQDQKILNSLGAPSPIAIQPGADESGVYGVDSFETKAFTLPPKLIRIKVPGVFKRGPK